jgi:E3 ubiquitin-protein ligase HUWE1
MDGPMGLLGELMEFLPMMGRNGNGQHAFHVQISGPGHRGADFGLPRLGRSEQRREISLEPHQAVAFSTESTVGRFNEEARMLFGANHVAEASKLGNAISAALTPDAIELEKKLRAAEEERKREEEARRKLEEEERLAREAKAAEEKAAKEKEEAEQREQEALRARAAGEIEEDNESTAMEGVETAEPSSTAAGTSVSGNERSTAPRVMTTIRGEEVDVTQLGIDPDYLAALPEEFREEVIAQTISERRSQARQTAPSGEPTEVFQEFLDALPEELRQEIAQQEAQEQRRRQRDEGRRQAAGATQGLLPTDMDTASILQSFAPELREQVLMDQGQDLMDQLPPEMAAQARLLADQRGDRIRTSGSQPITLSGGHQIAPPGPASGHATSKGPNDGKQARRTVIQMIDKAGVATLLRLMFITQQGSFRNYLFGVFADVCENRQSRLEVISTVLQILQDGTTDIHAVERSFGQLSIKAKRLKDNKDKDRETDQRTPQSLKRTLTTLTVANTAHSSSETSPLLIVQQCLDLLVDLCVRNPHVAWLFLTEHEIIGASIRKAFKGKAKVKDPKANKFAINTLLGLLDRELVTENSTVMTHLADLLNRVTIPLQNLERRRKESLDASAQSGKPNLEDSKEKNADNVDGSSAAPESAGQGESQTAKKDEPQQKRTRQLQPPLIPEENLTLVVRIFVARECSSKTFQNTIATIKNLCAIPGTKAIFGQELTKQARSLSEHIVTDLNDLLPHILAAKSGTEIQGVALAKFSPGASEQNKLLRVLTALDHLFDVKKKNADAGSDSTNNGDKQDWLTPLYHNETFIGMWDKLSACLSAIRQRENMLSVATILLPLIESLMVVCKNTTAKEDTAPGQPTKEGAASSPQEESQTASLFFTFTEEHRRILNELVRHSPKLMSGTFALLVRNPKVLEFDNKRNYFNRSVHSRSQNNGRASVPLSLSVRRESVFRDSFTALYYKSGEEIKHGKLNIRFNGEEGVDAGGVTREWFQVLARQMFDPNNALFIPVSSDRTTFHPNKLSKYQRDDTDHQLDHLMFFKFIGRIIGKALYEGRLLDCFFSRAVYKRILGKSVSVKDMESFDPDYYKSLCWMLENDITDIITETFSEEEDEFGVTKTVDLIPNGRDIPVTEENKHEYVRLVVRHRLLSSVQDQMEAFLKGT